MSRYHTVIWDWNGTLLDDVHLALRIANDVFAENGVARITRQRYIQIFDFPVKEYYERAGLFLSESRYESISLRFCEEFEAHVATARLFPCVGRILSEIGQCGLQQFVLSGTEDLRLHRMLRQFEISTFFDGIKGMSDGLAHSKISAAEELIDEFQLVPEGTVLVGDTTHDYEVAKKLGADCLLLSTGHQSFDRLSEPGCPVFQSLEEIQDHLLRN